MKKSEVEVGKVYQAKVSNKLVPVQILKECNGERAVWKLGERRFKSYTWWLGVNTKTGRNVVIKSAAKLRKEVG